MYDNGLFGVRNSRHVSRAKFIFLSWDWGRLREAATEGVSFKPLNFNKAKRNVTTTLP